MGLTQLIDTELGDRVKLFGFQYGEIIRNLTNVFLGGGGCIEDIGTHLGDHLKTIPGNNVPSLDTVLRSIQELSTANTSFTSKAHIFYDLYINNKFNKLNIKSYDP